MSSRRRQRRSRFIRGGALTIGELCELEIGFIIFAGLTGFSSTADMEKAWWRYRDTLLAECRPLERPFAYWAFEAHGRDRRYESEADSLLRLNLPLRPQEKRLLLADGPPYIPTDGNILPEYLSHWRQVARSITIRIDWHRREGRQEQADQWVRAGESLRRVLEKMS